MEYRDIVTLADRGGLSSVLREKWRRRTGHDPLAMAKTIVKHDRRLSRLDRALYATIGVGISFVVLGATLAGLGAQGVTRNQSEILVAVGLVDLLIVAFIWWPLSLNRKSSFDLFPTKAFGFGHFLNSLSEWTERTAADLSRLSEPQLRLLAEKILVKQAGMVLKWENENFGVPQEHWSGEAERLTSEFEWKYRVLSDLGIAGGPYKKFYDRARTLLKGEIASPSAS